MRKKSVLASTGFFRVWAAESISLTGAQITTFALPLVAAVNLDASPWEMSLLVAAAGMASLTLGLSAGVMADKYERTAVMHVANFARLAVLMSVPFLYWADALSVWLLALVTYLISALSLLFESAMTPYVPRLVGRDKVGPANSWLEASEAVGDVGGPGLAGILVQSFGAPIAVVIDACSYVVSSAALIGLPKAHPAKERRTEEPAESHFGAIRSGLRVLRRDRYQWPLAVTSVFFNFFSSVFAATYMLYALRVVGLSPALLGLMTMLGGVAGLTAAMVNQRMIARFGIGPTAIIGLALPGVTGLPVGLVHHVDRPLALVLIGIAQFSWVFGIVVMHVCVNTMRQTMVPEHLQGRIISSARFMGLGVQPLGALTGGAIASTALGLPGALVTATAGLILAAVWPLFTPVRTLRTVDDQDDHGDDLLPPREPAVPADT
ncbi:MFS transporter [Streptomyces sp. NPDC050732]|uniref:MFS transporter n=1 Tax=Streptomyces sp. NPDC050732 TaxID=3154632 RepID=UPI003438A38A